MTDADVVEQCKDCFHQNTLIIRDNKHHLRNGLHEQCNSLESVLMLILCENRLLFYSHWFLLFFDSVILWTYRSSEHMFTWGIRGVFSQIRTSTPRFQRQIHQSFYYAGFFCCCCGNSIIFHLKAQVWNMFEMKTYCCIQRRWSAADPCPGRTALTRSRRNGVA